MESSDSMHGSSQVEEVTSEPRVSSEKQKCDTPEYEITVVEEIRVGAIPIHPKIKSLVRQYTLLAVFCLAQFLDNFNMYSVMAAIPTIASQLKMSSNEEIWIISATQLAFASFLLLSGRISDVYSAKRSFIVGISVLGILNVITGLMRNKIALFVLRALSGAFASLTIPSSLNLIIKVFPEPLEQSRAVALFGASGTIGTILGLFIGAIFIQYASWPWVFWFAAIIATPVALVGMKLIPGDEDDDLQMGPEASKMKGLDLIGVSLLTSALVLFIYSITTGSAGKWVSAGVLVPMFVSIALFIGFFYYESKIPGETAALPPKTWSYPNFLVLSGVALLPYLWWTTVFVISTNYWQNIFGWSAIKAAAHQVPLSIVAFATTFTGPVSRVINPKWLILTGMVMTIVGTALLPFASTTGSYWPLVFPAFLLGSSGMQMIYTHTNIAMFRSTPPRMAGTVGAVFNSSLQLGSAVGSAAVTSITASLGNKPGESKYRGQAASYWFLLAIVGIEALAVLVLYKPRRVEHNAENEKFEYPQPEQIGSNSARV